MKKRNKIVSKPLPSTYGAISAAEARRLVTKGRTRKSPSRRGTLAGPYMAISEGLNTYNEPGAKWPVIVPDSMDAETNAALHKLRDALGGDVSQFVQERLGYESHEALYEAFVAEQVDAIALLIYNIEVRQEGCIIADQTGIGKGRIAAGLMRYAHHQGLIPIFLTERPNLFTDIYRDLKDIGSEKLRPFIVNGREKKTNVQDVDGNVLYQAPPANVQKGLIERVADASGGTGSGDTRDAMRVLDNYEIILGTYSQFNLGFDWESNQPLIRNKKKVSRSFGVLNDKCRFLATAVQGSIIILDESHNASGASNTGEFMAQVLGRAKGVGFLSATFAKRPDNMVVYGKKTVLNEAGLTDAALVQAIVKGGVALQEIISSQLVGGGQLLRRERPYAGVEVNWLTLHAQAAEHRQRSDEMMAILRDIISFQGNFINPYITAMGKSGAGKVEKTKGTDQGGISNTPMFSRVFNMVFQMLFGIKAEAVAQHAIDRLRSGKKVIITFQSTMGAFLEGLSGEGDDDTASDDDGGMTMEVDARVRATFDVVLERVLILALAYTETSPAGTKTKKYVDVDHVNAECKQEYVNLLTRIKNVTTEVSISPIDLVAKIIKQAGFPVAEVTGRGLFLDLDDSNKTGIVRRRVKEDTASAFRRFNRNEVDCLMLNAAGSTGASAHAVPVKGMSGPLKQRVMIIHQPSLDINTEVQKRGRVFRTGQELPPIYDYLVSAIPAEQRLMMMLQRKLKSLDANTTSNQKNSSSMMDAEFPDFLNHHGDRIVGEYLMENVTLNKRLGDPLAKAETGEPDDDGNMELKKVPADFALKVTGRVAVLATKLQTEFYTEISERYKTHINYLDETGQNDLEVKDLDLRAVVSDRQPFLAGQGGRSQFGSSVFLETCTVRNLTKPMTAPDVLTAIRESLNGRTAEEAQNELCDEITAFYGAREAGRMDGFEWNAAIEKELVRRKTPKNLKKENPEAYAGLIALVRSDLETSMAEEAARIRSDRSAMLSYARNWKIGYGCSVPNPDVIVHVGANDYLPAAFLGFSFPEGRRNPYAKSAFQMKFAVAAPIRSLTLPASSPLGKLSYHAAYGQSKQWSGPLTAEIWERKILAENSDTERRHILSGNLLLALGSPDLTMFRLPLVSFTMADGSVRKGILLPRKFTQDRPQNSDGSAARLAISQGLRSKGLAKRLAQIFDASMEYGKMPIRLEMRDSMGTVLFNIRADGNGNDNGGGYGNRFRLMLGWDDKKWANQGKAYLKNLPLMEALGKSNELEINRGGSYDMRFIARYVPVRKLEKVLDALGKLNVVVNLYKQILDEYPDLFPENRDFDKEVWPTPANMLPPRAVKPGRPVKKGTAPTPPAPDRARALQLAKAKVIVLALAKAKARARGGSPVLSGVKRRSSPKSSFGHPNIKAFIR